MTALALFPPAHPVGQCRGHRETQPPEKAMFWGIACIFCHPSFFFFCLQNLRDVSNINIYWSTVPYCSKYLHESCKQCLEPKIFLKLCLALAPALVPASALAAAQDTLNYLFDLRTVIGKKLDLFCTATCGIFYRTPAGYTADRKTRRKRNMGCYEPLSASCHPSPTSPPPTPPRICRTACGHQE